ncbi:hypothetical protein BC830DRAFT_1128394 [Chytriomyces sp. MP71]|nr:hypothetical protein BC830DRAFT_1128394 [Chytriomyces sp. MP71]
MRHRSLRSHMYKPFMRHASPAAASGSSRALIPLVGAAGGASPQLMEGGWAVSGGGGTPVLQERNLRAVTAGGEGGPVLLERAVPAAVVGMLGAASSGNVAEHMDAGKALEWGV